MMYTVLETIGVPVAESPSISQTFAYLYMYSTSLDNFELYAKKTWDQNI